MSDDTDRIEFALPPRRGFYKGIDLAELDPFDEDELAILVRADHADHLHEESIELHLLLHQVLTNQLMADDPPEVWQQAKRLLALGLPAMVVNHLLLDVVGRHLQRAVVDREPFHIGRYVNDLAALPDVSLEAAEDDEIDGLVIAALEDVLAGGCLDESAVLDEVVARTRLDEEIVLDVIDELLDSDGWLGELADGRLCDRRALVEGTVSAHRVADDELACGALKIEPDLVALVHAGSDAWNLAGGGEAEFTFDDDPDLAPIRAATSEPKPVIRASTDWLDGISARDLVALEIAGDTVELERLTAVDELGSARAVRAIAAAVERVVELQGDDPILLGDLFIEVAADEPAVFRRPMAPLAPMGELLARAGVEEHGGVVGRPGTDWVRYDRLVAVRLRLEHVLFAHQAGPDTSVLAHLVVEEVMRRNVLGDVASSVAKALCTPLVAEIVARTVVGPDADEEDVAGLERLAQEVVAHAPGGATGGGHHLLAAVAEHRGDALRGEREAAAAISSGLRDREALSVAAWYAFDRGDVRKARSLLVEAMAWIDPIEGRLLQEFGVSAHGAERNQPCPCGSGRKYKQCHGAAAGANSLPLAERVPLLEHKAHSFMRRPNPRQAVLHIARRQLGPAASPGELESAAIVNRLASTLALVEDRWLERFVAERGVLLPTDERDLLDRWLACRREVFEVVAMVKGRPGPPVVIIVDRSGRRYEVADRYGPRDRSPGEFVAAVPVPDGERRQFLGPVLGVPAEEVDGLAALLASGPTAVEVAGFIADRLQPALG